MLKVFAILAVLLLGITVYVTIEDQHAAEQAPQQAAQQPNAPIPLGVDNNQPQNNAQKSSGNLPSWHRLFTWPDGMTTWAILLTLWAVAWQANETKKAAEAALLNTQAVINSERPWIVMTIGQGKKPNEFLLKAVNRGRTPAAILSAGEAVAIIEPGTPLPAVPKYTRVKKYEAPVMLIQGEYQTVLEFDRKHLRSLCDDRERFAKAEECSQMTYIFGNVIYKDLLASAEASPHETRWCCTVWLMDEEDELFFTEGSSEYTRHT